MSGSLLKSTFIYTLLGFLPLSFGLIFTPLYTFYLSTDQMGVLNLFTLITSISVGFYSLGIDSAFSYLYFDFYKNPKTKIAFLSTAVITILGISLFVMALSLLIGYFFLPDIINSSDKYTFSPFWILSSISPLFIVLYNVFLFFYRNENNLRQYALLNISTLIFMTIGTLIGVIILKQNALGSIAGRMLGQIVPVLVTLGWFFLRFRSKFDHSLAKRLFSVGAPIFIYLLLGQLSTSIDRIIIERFFKLSDLGIYGVALVIGSVAEVWIGAISNAVSPNLYKLMKEDLELHGDQIRKLLNILFISTTFMIVCIIAFVNPVVKLLLSVQYHSAIYFVPVICAGFIGRVLYVTFVTILFSHQKTEYLPYINLITLITSVAASLIFIPFFGVLGVGIATLLSRLIQVPVVIYLSRRTSPFRFHFKKNILFSATILVSIGLIYFLIPHLNNYLLFTFPLLLFIVFICFISDISIAEYSKNILNSVSLKKK